jgi:hypothetical protein
VSGPLSIALVSGARAQSSTAENPGLIELAQGFRFAQDDKNPGSSGKCCHPEQSEGPAFSAFTLEGRILQV